MRSQRLNELRRASQVLTHSGLSETKQGEEDIASTQGRGSGQESQSANRVRWVYVCGEGGKDGSLVTFEGTDKMSKYVKYF